MQVRRARLPGEAEEADHLPRLDPVADRDRRTLFQMFVGRDAAAADVEHDVVAAGVGNARVRAALDGRGVGHVVADRDDRAGGDRERSAEHTSELQYLMRISYAVF